MDEDGDLSPKSNCSFIGDPLEETKAGIFFSHLRLLSGEASFSRVFLNRPIYIPSSVSFVRFCADKAVGSRSDK